MEEITVQELAGWQEEKIPILLVDVREPDEWEICRLPGAVLLPLGQLETRAPVELPCDATIVLYCHHGMRSASAQYYLASLGYQRTFNLRGGIERWALDIEPGMQRY